MLSKFTMHLAALVLLMLAALSEARSCTTVAVKKSPPSSAVCNGVGKLEKPAVIKSYPHQMSRQGVPCIDDCFKTRGCMSISAEQTNHGVRTCTLYSKPIENMALNTSASDPTHRVFVDISCYRCVQCNLQTQGPNLQDGTFDDSTTSISPWVYSPTSGTEHSLVPGQTGDGNAFSATLASNQAANLTQKLGACAQTGKLFKFSFDYAFGTQDLNYVSYIKAYVFTNFDTFYPADTAWHTYENKYYFDSNHPRVQFQFYDGSTSNQTFEIDNVVLVPAH